MPTYRLTVAYDGTDFVGWQCQRNGPSIQTALEAALSHLFGHPIACRGAGRTDAGVHASGQVVTFRSERQFANRNVVYGTNDQLPPSIAVMSAETVSDDFDARFSASGKLYRYHLWNGPVRSPLHVRTHWHVYNGQPLDVAAMREAAVKFVGRHDFAAFRASHCERLTTVRTMRRVEVLRPIERDDRLPPQALHIEVEATAFLRNMVRIIAGTLVHVGRGRMSADDVAAILQAGDRKQAGPTAPAHGLELCRVDYGPRDGM
jgi:tRNA pseudouridine38-40 synthase